MNETAQRILDLAEVAIATKGYSAFSFRELADAMDIKSASVHYHFPTKAHLGVAVAERYRARYANALNEITRLTDSPAAALQALADLFRQQIADGERMTVCMMLAAEIKQLPKEIQQEMRAFYFLNREWLQRLVQRQLPGVNAESAAIKANQIFALLQGAMMGAKTQNDIEYFDHAIQAIGYLLHQ